MSKDSQLHQQGFEDFIKLIKYQNDKIYENQYMVFWKEGEILNGCYKKGSIIGAEAATDIINFRKKHFPGKVLALVYVYNLGCITKEAKSILSSKEASEDLIKGAILVKTFLYKTLANAYLNLIPTQIPTKVFTDKTEAVQWLLKK